MAVFPHNSCAHRKVRSSGFAAVILNIPFVSKKIHPSVYETTCYRSRSPASCDLKGKKAGMFPGELMVGEGIEGEGADQTQPAEPVASTGDVVQESSSRSREMSYSFWL